MLFRSDFDPLHAVESGDGSHDSGDGAGRAHQSAYGLARKGAQKKSGRAQAAAEIHQGEYQCAASLLQQAAGQP